MFCLVFGPLFGPLVDPLYSTSMLSSLLSRMRKVAAVSSRLYFFMKFFVDLGQATAVLKNLSQFNWSFLQIRKLVY